MNCLGPLILLAIFSLSALTILNASRVKRRVVFNQNSKFFCRLNGKTNILNATGIFAHGWTIRINYDLPDTIPKINKIFKRSLDTPKTENEFSSLASSCLSSHICQMFRPSSTNSTCGFFCEIRKIINSSKGPQADYIRSYLDNCYSSGKECPLDTRYFEDMVS